MSAAPAKLHYAQLALRGSSSHATGSRTSAAHGSAHANTHVHSAALGSLLRSAPGFLNRIPMLNELLI